MKIDPNAPAYPNHGVSPGMTIRAAMATQMHAALLNAVNISGTSFLAMTESAKKHHGGDIRKTMAQMAVNHTDTLIEALNGDKP